MWSRLLVLVCLECLIVDETPQDFLDMIYKHSGGLSKEAQSNFLGLCRRLDTLFSACEENRMCSLIDAEQSYYQKGIHILSLYFMARHNKTSPKIYNTYQMYLTMSHDIIMEHIDLANKHNFHLGAKVST